MRKSKLSAQLREARTDGERAATEEAICADVVDACDARVTRRKMGGRAFVVGVVLLACFAAWTLV